MNNYDMEVSVDIKAAPNQVWEAITNPAKVKQYFFGTNLVTTWEVGTPVLFQGEWEGKPYEDKGTVLAFEPESRLQFNYWSNFSGKADIPENYSVITYELTSQGERTRITVRQDNCLTQEARDDSAANWQLVLDGLKQMLEQK